MGKPDGGNAPSSVVEYIGGGSELGEVNHLSTRRKRKATAIPQVAASERGTAQTDAMSSP